MDISQDSSKRKSFRRGIIILVVIVCVFVVITRFFDREGGYPFGERIAIVEVKGVINNSEEIIRALHKYKKDKSVKAIVVRINSPGGAVAPSQEIYEEINKIKTEKRVVVSMGSMAASGGYYIASAADKIFANPGTITGSIGVLIEFANIEELLSKLGIKGHVIKSGKYKDTLSPTREITDEERNYLQAVADNIHAQFIDSVAKSRGLERESVVDLADGRILTGAEAQKLGLVDFLGNFQDAIEYAGKIAGIKGTPQVIYPQKSRFSILDLLFNQVEKRIKEIIDNQLFRASYLFTSQKPY